MNNSDNQKGDLSYYMHDGATTFRFQVAGTLSKSSVRDLEQAWETASSVIGNRIVIVDVSELTSIDASGQEVLRGWHARGAQIVAISLRAGERLRLITDEPITVLEATKAPAWRPFSARRVPGTVRIS